MTLIYQRKFFVNQVMKLSEKIEQPIFVLNYNGKLNVFHVLLPVCTSNYTWV